MDGHVLVEVQERFQRGRRTPGGPETELEVHGLVDFSLVPKFQGRHEHAEIEHLDFGLHAGLLHHPGRLVEEGRVVDEGLAPQVDRAGVVGGEFRLQLQRGEPFRRRQVPSGDAARREAEDEVRFLPDFLDDAPEQVDVLASESRLGVANVDVDDRGAGLPGLDGRPGDLVGRDRDVGGDVPHHAAPRDGCGDDDFFHAGSLPRCET